MRRSPWLLPSLLLAARLGAAGLSVTAGTADDLATAPEAEAALDDQAFHHSFYIHLDVGAQRYNDASWRPGSSLLASGAYEGTTSDTTELLELGLGYASPDGLGVELGFGAAPIDTLYVMPVFRLATDGLGSRPLIHTLGARAGWSSLGTSSSSDYYYGYNNGNGGYGTYDSLPGFPSYAVSYRLEQMLSAHLSLGLELAYHFANVSVGISQTVWDTSLSQYVTQHSTVDFDYSGPSVCVSLAFWPMHPFWGAADVRAQKEDAARRVARAEARAARVRQRYAPPQEDAEAPERRYAGVDEALSVGQAAMDIQQPARARQAFEEAVLLAPQSAKAWRGLADAEYALALRRRALTHYERALALGGADPALKAFIEQLRARLAEDADRP